MIAKTGLGSQNAVCGGGRYDSLVEDFDGPPTPCFGFALGMHHLHFTPNSRGLQDLQQRPDIYLVCLGEEAQQLAFPVTHQLRAVGLYVEREIEGGSMKSQMRKANKLESRFALIIGEDEINNKQYVLKNMDGGEQWQVAADTLAKEVQSRIKSFD